MSGGSVNPNNIKTILPEQIQRGPKMTPSAQDTSHVSLQSIKIKALSPQEQQQLAYSMNFLANNRGGPQAKSSSYEIPETTQDDFEDYGGFSV